MGAAAYALWHRELVRFLRQPSRVVSAVASPLLFWVLIGSGLSSSFRLPGGPADLDYLEYFFPGIVVLLVLFAAIFATISVIDDRHEGFLQGVLVSPAPRAALVAGKVGGGATLAWLQAAPLLLLAPLAGISLGPARLLAAAGVLALMAVALTGIGFAFAWKVDSTQGFHGVMNLLLVPMWLLSGAFFPLSGTPVWLEWVMRVNPLTYGMTALRRVLYTDAPTIWAELPGMPLSIAVLGVWCAVALVVDLALVRRGGGV